VHDGKGAWATAFERILHMYDSQGQIIRSKAVFHLEGVHDGPQPSTLNPGPSSLDPKPGPYGCRVYLEGVHDGEGAGVAEVHCRGPDPGASYY